MRQRIATRVGRSLVVVETKDITHFSAEEKYVTAFTSKGQIHFEATLKDLEVEFAEEFVRIHRSHLVRRSLITGLRWKAYAVSIGLAGTNIRLPLSRNRASFIRELLNAAPANAESIAMVSHISEPSAASAQQHAAH